MTEIIQRHLFELLFFCNDLFLFLVFLPVVLKFKLDRYKVLIIYSKIRSTNDF